MEKLSIDFYEKNHLDFSDTRFCLWDVVRDFGKKFTKDSFVLDAGCGNGKNIKFFQNKTNIAGVDKSSSLVNLCQQKGYNVIQGDILQLPYENNTFDYIICIAVVHHLDSEEKRISAIKEMVRVLKPNGKLLITCWAFESDEYSKKKKFKIGDNLLSFRNKQNVRFYHIYNKNGFESLCQKSHNNYLITWERGNWNAIFTN